MKLLVFAHKPPPHHGQSYMVQLLLDGLKGSAIQLFHVDARLSSGLEDIGRVRFTKLFLLLKYCLQAIALRLRHGIENFYYIPANGSRTPLYRDWLVMALCRPFFRRTIFHWQAAGLGEWLAQSARPWERWVTKRLLGGPNLSIVLGDYNRRDAEALESRNVAVIHNAIADPRPDFEKDILPVRLAQAEKRRSEEAYTFQVLFLGLCCRSKGLFDLLEAVAIANDKLRGTPVRIKLAVGGTFYSKAERAEFEKRVNQTDLINWVEYKGFVTGDDKRALLRTSDCLCFPTYYEAESFGLVLIEAMAYGLPVVITNWRNLPELVPPDYEHVVEPRSPAQLARALMGLLGEGYDSRLRAHFLEHYTDELFIAKIRTALLNL
jgi:glycosyltransferase involved in cell wall biosynthesis